MDVVWSKVIYDKDGKVIFERKLDRPYLKNGVCPTLFPWTDLQQTTASTIEGTSENASEKSMKDDEESLLTLQSKCVTLLRKKYRGGGHFCAARNCKTYSMRSKISFFRFPKDTIKAKVWVLACGREDMLNNLENLYANYRLCGLHFENRMFLNDLKNRLQSHAVPTIFQSQEASSVYFDHNYSAASNIVNISSKTENTKVSVGDTHDSQVLVPASSTNIETCSTIADDQDEDSVIQTVTVTPSVHRIQQIMSGTFSNTCSPINMRENIVITSTGTQTSKSLTANSPRINILRKKNKALKYKISRLEKKLNDLQNNAFNIDNISLEQYKYLTYKFCRSRKTCK